MNFIFRLRSTNCS